MRTAERHLEPAKISRPNTAPAYYLGHPAHLWITVMGPQTTNRPAPA
jgi:hypothetical protein